MRSRPLAGLLLAATATLGFVACSSGGDDDDTTTGPTTSSGAGGDGAQGGAATGGGGQGGTGGEVIVEENSGEDQCPGDPYEIDHGQTFVLKGTTADSTDDYKSFCGDTTAEMDGKDRVYAITVAQAGTFTVELTEGTFLPAISMRTACDDEATGFYCFAFETQEKITKQHIEPGTYYVFVDAAPGLEGEYEFSLSLTESACGDGVLAPAEEQCDPEPVAADDGCTDPGDPLGGCKYEMPDIVKETCPGEEHQVTTAGLTLAAADGHTTLGYVDDYIGSCMGTMGGKDHVYQLTPQTAGTMTVTVGFEVDGTTETCMVNPTLEGCWDYALHARTTCGDVATEVDCSDTAAPEVISFPVTAGTPYFVFVDGYDDQPYSDGTYNLIITLQ